MAQEKTGFYFLKELCCLIGTAFMTLSSMLIYLIVLCINLDFLLIVINTMLSYISNNVFALLLRMLLAFAIPIGSTLMVGCVVCKLMNALCSSLLHDKDWLNHF